MIENQNSKIKNSSKPIRKLKINQLKFTSITFLQIHYIRFVNSFFFIQSTNQDKLKQTKQNSP